MSLRTPDYDSNRGGAFPVEVIQEKSKSRIRLKGCDSRIPTFAAKTLENMTRWDKIKVKMGLAVVTRVVDEQGQSKDICVNVGSIAKRMGVTRQVAKELIQQEGFFSRAAALSQTILRSFDEQTSSGSFSSETVRPNPLYQGSVKQNSQQVEKIFTKVFSLSAPRFLTGADLDSFNIQNKSDHLVKNGENIYLYELGCFLGSGSFGEVFKIKDVMFAEREGGSEEIIKIAKRSKDTSVEQEYAILKELNPDGRVQGIQLAPRKVVQLGKEHESLPAYIAPMYESDMTRFRARDASDIKNVFRGLTGGMLHMHQQGWVHGDIKPENMLQKKGPPVRHDIADLGGAQKNLVNAQTVREALEGVLELKKACSRIWGVSTEGYYDPMDKQVLKYILKTAQQKIETDPASKEAIIQKAQEDINSLLQVRDIYAMARSVVDFVLNSRMDVMDRPEETLQELGMNEEEAITFLNTACTILDAIDVEEFSHYSLELKNQTLEAYATIQESRRSTFEDLRKLCA